ncbi:MAG: hypothetical protein HC890_08330 [Chloroflexaceae bacterium]|nr:hypothetical protein [Chloroflexaceae bacterium]
MQFSPNSKVIVQGIATFPGSGCAPRMKAYGTNIVAGVEAGSGGRFLDTIPVFDLVEQAVFQLGNLDISLICVPPYAVLDAALEAIAAGIKQLVLLGGGVPPLDVVKLLERGEASNTCILGPGQSGILIPGQFWLGGHEPLCYQPAALPWWVAAPP